MKLTLQFFGGILVGLAFGMLIGAAIAEKQKVVNYSSMAGVGVMLAIVGMVAAQRGSPKS